MNTSAPTNGRGGVEAGVFDSPQTRTSSAGPTATASETGAGNTISIADRDGFGAKVTAITEAAAGLRAMSGELDAILAGVRDETSTFTADGAAAAEIQKRT